MPRGERSRSSRVALERRIPLCSGIWRHDILKICFLRDALVSEDWIENTLPCVGATTSWLDLCTELGSALHIRIELEGDSREIMAPAISSTSKPNIFFAAQVYAKMESKATISG